MNRGNSYHASAEKRALDLGVATVFIGPTTVVAAMVAAGVMVETGKPPVFRQARIGQGTDQSFSVVKIRTLHGEITHEPARNGYQNQRATRIGQIARKMHADEVPQLYQVISASMSIVGPRPLVPVEHEEVMDNLSYAEQLEYLDALKICKPGIVAPDSHLIHRGAIITPSLRAESTINYAHNASLQYDLQQLGRLTIDVVHDHLPKRTME